MSSQSTANKATPVKQPNEANESLPLHHGHSLNKKSEPVDETPEKEQQGGFSAVGRATAPLTQPVNYAIKGTTRAVNGTVGVTTSVANGLVSGTTSVLGTTAEATLPKGMFFFSEIFSFWLNFTHIYIQALVNPSRISQMVWAKQQHLQREASTRPQSPLQTE